MGTFIVDGAAVLPPVKSDLRPPSGAVTEWAAEDANEIRDALLDLRTEALSPTNNVVTLDGAQTITGVKDFTALPTSGLSPTSGVQFANKSYVDATVSQAFAAPVADVAALRALPSAAIAVNEHRLVLSNSYVYYYNPSGTGTDDGTTIIKPNDVTTSGRWFQTSTGAYLPLAGGTISGDLVVSGTVNGATVGGSAAGTVLGSAAFAHNSSGTGNVAVGTSALHANISGYNNVSVGASALAANLSGHDNAAVGTHALEASTASFNSAVGSYALYSNAAGKNNSALGLSALQANVGGDNNVAVGVNSLRNAVSGIDNVAVGYTALFNDVSGKYNVAVGSSALYASTAGYRNTAVGMNALRNNTTGVTNTVVGYSSAGGLTTGSKNTILGAYVTGLSPTLSNTIIIADGDGNQRIVVDSTGDMTASVKATGSTTLRTLASRAADTVNPMDFGAHGTGAPADGSDTDAVQAAVDYCLSFTPPKALAVTHSHFLASSVNIDRLVNTIADKSYFRITGQGDHAGFYTTADINLFSSTILRVGPDVKSGRVAFRNIEFSTDDITHTTNVLDETFMRVSFDSCTFHYIRCYNYGTAFTQEFRWTDCLITEWTGMFAGSIGSYNAVFQGCHIWDYPANSTGLFASTGSTYSANVVMSDNVIEWLGGPIATISGGYGCKFSGNQIEYIAGSAFVFNGMPTSNITFGSNYCVLYSGPFVAFSAANTGYVTSYGNNLTVTQFTAAGGTRVMYGGMTNVAGLTSSGDNMTRADGLSGAVCVISDAAHITHMNGVERHGAAIETWTDTTNQITKDTTGHFAFGDLPNIAARVVFRGEDTSAAHYAATFDDSNGNPIATFRNDRVVSIPNLLNYATNAAAITGGLVAGDLYRTGGAVMVVT